MLLAPLSPPRQQRSSYCGIHHQLGSNGDDTKPHSQLASVMLCSCTGQLFSQQRIRAGNGHALFSSKDHASAPLPQGELRSPAS